MEISLHSSDHCNAFKVLLLILSDIFLLFVAIIAVDLTINCHLPSVL